MMRSEYQRIADKQSYLSYVHEQPQVDYVMADDAKRKVEGNAMAEDLNKFMLQALNGILIIVQA